MKRFLILLVFVGITSAIIAQSSDSFAFQFPKKGYKVKWRENIKNSFGDFSCHINKFEDSDSLYYIIYSNPKIRPYCMQFCFLSIQEARVIHTLMQQQNKEGQKRFIRHLLNLSKANELDHITRYNHYWTYFKPRVNERWMTKNFSLGVAIYAYNRDREKDRRLAEITPEQWMALFNAAKVVLPMIGESGPYTRQEQYYDPSKRNQ